MSSYICLGSPIYIERIVGELNNVIGLIDYENISGEHKEKFINFHFPQIVKIIVGQKYINVFTSPLRHSNTLLCFWLSRRLKNFIEYQIGDALVFRYIFSPKKNFYLAMYSSIFRTDAIKELTLDIKQLGILTDTSEAGNEDWSWNLIPSDFTTSVVFFYVNVYCFAKLGGFNIIRSIIEEGFMPERLKFQLKILKGVGNMVEYLSVEQWEKYVYPLADMALNSLLGFIDARFRDVGMEEVMKLIKTVEGLTGKFKDPRAEAIRAKTEHINSQILTKLIMNDLEHSGITKIFSLVGMHKEKRKSKYIIDQSTIIKLITENNILDKILTEEQLTVQVIQKAIECNFFGLLYTWKVINTITITQLWTLLLNSKSGGKRKAISIIFDQLISRFTPDDRTELFNRIKEVEPEGITSDVIDIVTSLTEKELNKTECLPLQYLLSLIQEEALNSGLKEVIQQLILTKLLEILSKASMAVTVSVIKECVELMCNDNSVIVISKLFFKLVGERVDEKIKDHLVEKRLAEKLLVNIVRFKLRVIKKGSKISISEDVYETLISHKALKLNYYQELNERFNILAKILKILPETFNPKFSSTLCKAFLLNNVSIKERNLFFELLEALVYSKLTSTALKSFEVIFYEVFLNLSPNAFTKSAFLSFKKLFILFNAYYRNIVDYEVNFEVTELELLGLTQLWQLVFCSSNEIYPLVSDFLMELYKSFSFHFIRREGRMIRDEFIEECIKELKGERASRALELLIRYIDIFESTKKFDNSIDEFHNETISFSVWWTDVANIFRADISMNPNTDTVECLVNYIKNKYDQKVNSASLILITSAGVLRATSQLIVQTDLKHRSDIRVCYKSNNKLDKLKEMFPEKSEQVLAYAFNKGYGEISSAAELLSSEKNVKTIEQELISATQQRLTRFYKEVADPLSLTLSNNSDCFRAVRSCLKAFSEDTQLKAINLLQKIPISDATLNSMSTNILNENLITNWQKVFPGSTMHELGYTLRVLQKLLKKDHGVKNVGRYVSATQKFMWIEVFVKEGGYEYLMKLLLNNKWQDYLKYEELLVLILKEITIQGVISFNKEAVKRFISQVEPKGFDHYSFSTERFKLFIYFKPEISKVMSKFIDSYDLLGKFVTKVIPIITKDTLKEQEVTILEHLLTLIGLILSYNFANYEKIYTAKTFFETAITMLLNSDNPTIREHLQKYLIALIETYQQDYNRTLILSIPPDIYCLKLLLQSLPIPTKHYFDPEDYFKLLIKLLPILKYKHGLDKQEYELKYTALTLTNKLAEYIIEIIKGPFKHTTLLAFYMEVISNLTDNTPSLVDSLKLVFESLCSYIFVLTNSQLLRSKYRSTLENLLSYILLCSQKDESMRTYLLKQICQFHEEQIQQSHKNSAHEDTLKEQCFIGLKNFGATCYINSLLQQFFMLPEFRYHILSLPIEKLPREGCNKILVHLQEIFSYLMLSEKPFYVPWDFFKNLTWDDHKPIAINTQHDVEEFYDIITDRLEKELKGLGKDKLIRDMFGVTLIHEIESLEIDKQFISAIEEPCLTLGLEVKNKSSIEDALSSFIKAEVMDGTEKYYCSKYDARIKASKRCIIKNISDTLIMHLKRFDFNSVTGIKKKLNDHCTFPLVIDFSKWIRDPKGEVLYDLIGVLVHSGTAEVGHYISIIKDLMEDSETKGKWFSFNDTIVKAFDIGQMSMYFGKKTTNQISLLSSTLMGDWEVNEGNAYLLVYQKKNIKSPIFNEELKELIPEIYKTKILNENLLGIKGKLYVNQIYTNFLIGFIKSLKTNTDLSVELLSSPIEDLFDKAPIIVMFKQLLPYTFDSLQKLKDSKQYRTLMTTIQTIVAKNRVLAIWTLNYFMQSKDILFETLIKNRLQNIRADTQELITKIMEMLIKEKELLSKFVEMLLSEGLSVVKLNVNHMEELFKCLTSFYKIEVGAQILLEQKIIHKLVDLLLNINSNLADKRIGSKSMFREPMMLLVNILKVTQTPEMIEKKSSPRPVPKSIGLVSREELENFFKQGVNITKMYSYEQKNFTSIVIYFCWESLPRTQLVFNNIINSFMSCSKNSKYKINADYVEQLIPAKEIISIKDSLYKDRIKLFFLETKVGEKSIVEILNYYNSLNEEFIMNMLDLLACACNDKELLEVAKSCLFDKLLWVPRYFAEILKKYRSTPFGIMYNSNNQRKIEYILKIIEDSINERMQKIESAKEVDEEYKKRSANEGSECKLAITDTRSKEKGIPAYHLKKVYKEDMMGPKMNVEGMREGDLCREEEVIDKGVELFSIIAEEVNDQDDDLSNVKEKDDTGQMGILYKYNEPLKNEFNEQGNAGADTMNLLSDKEESMKDTVSENNQENPQLQKEQDDKDTETQSFL